MFADQLVEAVVFVRYPRAVRVRDFFNVTRFVIGVRIRFAVVDVVLDAGVGGAVDVGVVFDSGVEFRRTRVDRDVFERRGVLVALVRKHDRAGDDGRGIHVHRCTRGEFKTDNRVRQIG